MYTIVDEGKEQQMLKNAQEAEAQVTLLLSGYDDAKSSLPEHGLDLARFIFDFDQAKKSLRTQGLDVSQLPFGMTSESRLARAFKILAQVQRHLVDSKAGSHAKLQQYSQEFYEIIPHDFGVTVPPTIDHILRLRDKTRIVEQLSDVDAMQKVAITSSKDGCIFENLLAELEVYLDHIDREDDLFEVIRAAVEHTRLPEHNLEVVLRDVFQVYKPADEIKYWSFDQKVHNKTLLFAGVK